MDIIIESSFNERLNGWQIKLSGEIDIFNSNEMKVKILDLVNEKNVNLYIDCHDLEYMDSTALGALVAILKNVKSYKGEVHLQRIRPNLVKLFKITNLDKIFILEGDTNDYASSKS